MTKGLMTVLSAGLLALGMVGTALAAPPTYLDPFTMDELADDWQADRQYPSGDVTSTSDHGRDEVAKVGIVGAEKVSGFRQYEGIKSVGDFGRTAQVDLYLDPAWEGIDTSVGLWVADEPLSAYAIIAFGSGTGFRVWNVNAWENADAPFEYGEWVTLSIRLDPDEAKFMYFVDGRKVGEVAATGDYIGQVFLNHYNYGTSDYEAHWHVGHSKALRTGGRK